MVGFGVVLVAVGKWFARNDVAWLSSVIEGALGEPKKGASAAMLLRGSCRIDCLDLAADGRLSERVLALG
jgi:hypothetical protein